MMGIGGRAIGRRGYLHKARSILKQNVTGIAGNLQCFAENPANVIAVMRFQRVFCANDQVKLAVFAFDEPVKLGVSDFAKG